MSRLFPLFILISVLMTDCSQQAPEHATQVRKVEPQRPWKLVCLGGSNTIGVAIPPEQAYPAVLAEALDEKPHPVKIVNAGIRGETIAGAQVRLSWILQQRLDAFLLALGEEKADQLLSLDEEQQLWEQMLKTLRNAYPRIPVFVLDLNYERQFPGWWQALQKTYKVHLLQPDWDTLIGPFETGKLWSAEEHGAIAEWLADELRAWPDPY